MLIKVKVAVKDARQALAPRHRGHAMPTETIIVISAIVTLFVVFGAVLAWADAQTRNLKR
jgi:hypothetical protein